MQLKGLIIKDGNEAGNPPPLDGDPTQYEKKSLPPMGMGIGLDMESLLGMAIGTRMILSSISA